MPLTLQLGDSRLPELCKRAKISQAALARQLGVSRQFIYKVKMREKNFTLAQGIHASIILKCDIRHLHHEIWKSAEYDFLLTPLQGLSPNSMTCMT